MPKLRESQSGKNKRREESSDSRTTLSQSSQSSEPLANLRKGKVGASKRRAVVASDEESMEVDSQSSVSQSTISVNNLHYEEQLKKVCNYFLISCNHQVPVTKANMKTHINVDLNRKMITDVTAKLEEKYGYTVREFIKDKFIITKQYTDDDINSSGNPHFRFDQEQSTKMGLLWIIACSVLMNGESITYSTLLIGLKSLGIEENIPHEVFGDIRSFLTKRLVKEGYLKIEKEENNVAANQSSTFDPIMNAKVYLGNRLLAMVDKQKVLQFVSKVYGNKPEDWCEQFEKFNST
ncbi:melanoma-associated antigen D1-like [Convolutriloba macropyga]|uniref:melanoma-associated antigen D1-like n=1 Tax=Convolutriloba macropyga TaxID=536237 RepID=UPI003F51DAD6